MREHWYARILICVISSSVISYEGFFRVEEIYLMKDKVALDGSHSTSGQRGLVQTLQLVSIVNATECVYQIILYIWWFTTTFWGWGPRYCKWEMRSLDHTQFFLARMSSHSLGGYPSWQYIHPRRVSREISVNRRGNNERWYHEQWGWNCGHSRVPFIKRCTPVNPLDCTLRYTIWVPDLVVEVTICTN